MTNTHKKPSRRRKAEMRMQRIVEAVKLQLQTATDNTQQLSLPSAQKAKTDEHMPGTETSQLLSFLQERYEFRYNLVMGYAEYRGKDNGNTWQAIDDREVNTLTMQARLSGINIWNSDTWRFVRSHMVADYHPVNSYLDSVRGTWDGQDHIARLAGTVSCNSPEWPTWFRRWILAVVAQWTGRSQQYGNAIAPLLISPQGYHKSTFCRQLLPPELAWGYIDSLIVAEKKQVMQAMSQMLLINLDEFNQVAPSVQSGFLKNVIQLSSVKMKRPYGKHVEEFQRLASFIATTNMTDVLTDPSGSRRFICVELTAPIDVSTPPCHRQLYAQILHLLDSGERYWFDSEETQHIMAHNQKYQLKSSAELLFDNFFEVTDDEQKGRYMSTTAIYDYLKRHGGSQLQSHNIVNFGRTLSCMKGIVKRRNKNGSEYLVTLK